MARMRGCIWLAAGLVVALLAGLVAFLTLNNATQRQQAAVLGEGGAAVPVVVAGQSVPVRSLLTPEMLQVKQMSVESAPQGYLSDIAQAAGKVTLIDLYPGEPILSPRLVVPNALSADGRMALVVAADEVLMAFPADDLMSQVGVLKSGDQVDILISLNVPVNRTTAATGGAAETEQQTFNVLQNATIAAVVAAPVAQGQPAGAPQALLLAVSPQNALILKYAKDMGGAIDLVLRAPRVDQEYDVAPVDADSMINRYQIPTEVGR
jgi:Flp pilus assembly protein CpaB